MVPMYPPKALVMETTGTGSFYANEKQRLLAMARSCNAHACGLVLRVDNRWAVKVRAHNSAVDWRSKVTCC